MLQVPLQQIKEMVIIMTDMKTKILDLKNQLTSAYKGFRLHQAGMLVAGNRPNATEILKEDNDAKKRNKRVSE